MIQSQPHPRLAETVARHARHPWRKPVADHNREAFRVVEKAVEAWDGPLVLDTGCGTGHSTRALAKRFPKALVLGIDKSADRLSRHPPREEENYRLDRIDLEDFWPLALAAGWKFVHQAVYYPNPWPKAEHRLRRWPFHPVFPVALQTGGVWELRTNWQVYALEMAQAFALLTGVEAPVEPWNPREPETLFEKKYQADGQELWRWTALVPAAVQPPTGS